MGWVFSSRPFARGPSFDSTLNHIFFWVKISCKPYIHPLIFVVPSLFWRLGGFQQLPQKKHLEDICIFSLHDDSYLNVSKQITLPLAAIGFWGQNFLSRTLDNFSFSYTSLLAHLSLPCVLQFIPTHYHNDDPYKVIIIFCYATLSSSITLPFVLFLLIRVDAKALSVFYCVTIITRSREAQSFIYVEINTAFPIQLFFCLAFFLLPFSSDGIWASFSTTRGFFHTFEQSSYFSMPPSYPKLAFSVQFTLTYSNFTAQPGLFYFLPTAAPDLSTIVGFWLIFPFFFSCFLCAGFSRLSSPTKIVQFSFLFFSCAF